MSILESDFIVRFLDDQDFCINEILSNNDCASCKVAMKEKLLTKLERDRAVGQVQILLTWSFLFYFMSG